MKTIVHVNQHNIKANAKGDGATLGRKPVLTVKTYKDNRKGNIAGVYDPDDNLIGKFVYRPEKPLSCGAKVWFETDYKVIVYEN